jgi:orotate phosphoribosyltransferase
MSSAAAREGLARRVYERAPLVGEFRLRSGAMKREYFDKYLFESDPELLRAVGSGLVALLPGDIDAVAGLELGGVPLATVVSQLTGPPALFVRRTAKEYGTRRLAEGGEVRGWRLAVIEDVVGTGGQLIDSCRALRERGGVVVEVLCGIDRGAVAPRRWPRTA